MNIHFTDRDGRRGPGTGSDAGFSLVELVVAVIVLAIGTLGLAGTTMYVVRQVTLSEADSERTAALQSVVERVRSQPFTTTAEGSEVTGNFEVRWEETSNDGQVKTVLVVTAGPGQLMRDGAMPILSNSVVDSFTFTVIRP